MNRVILAAALALVLVSSATTTTPQLNLFSDSPSRSLRFPDLKTPEFQPMSPFRRPDHKQPSPPPKNQSNPQSTSSITISGVASLSFIPDVTTLTITLTENQCTAKGALAKATAKSTTILNILNTTGVAKADIQAPIIYVTPVYQYINNNARLTTNQASQTITVKLRGALVNSTIIAGLVDDINRLQHVVITTGTFDVENKTALYEQARIKAIDDAKSKGTQLAQLSGYQLGTARDVNEKMLSSTPATGLGVGDGNSIIINIEIGVVFNVYL